MKRRFENLTKQAGRAIRHWWLMMIAGVLCVAAGIAVFAFPLESYVAMENLQFITFLVNVISAVYKHNGLLKASVMSATNEHRLGAGEAPPAIISTFLGAQISAVLDKLEASPSSEAIRFDAKSVFRMSGISRIPSLFLDNTDRNRTSPYPRAVRTVR